eukprot:TRINITY_DN3625_c0_g1_i1.p1 TRINITY_DN3625_c0_g1~~TRINITY_DN3625_c0_g1_i1.p1  ORF type:complete len:586 (-),score=132.43 TRINITY_DN3625_c0_g1_i1:1327-2973(-)
MANVLQQMELVHVDVAIREPLIKKKTKRGGRKGKKGKKKKDKDEETERPPKKAKQEEEEEVPTRFMPLEYQSDSDSSSDEEEPTEGEKEIVRRRMVLNAALFNHQLIALRESRGVFYYEPHTHTHQMLGSWIVPTLEDAQESERQRLLKVELEQQLSKEMKRVDMENSIPQVPLLQLQHVEELIDSPPRSPSGRRSRSRSPVNERRSRAKEGLPKGPINSFMYFAMEKRPKLKDKYPNMTHTELNKLVTLRWKKMDEEDKYEYEHLAQLDRERHQNELEEYRLKKKEERELFLKTATASQVALPPLHYPKSKAPQGSRSLQAVRDERKSNLLCQSCGEKFGEDSREEEEDNHLRCRNCCRGFHIKCADISEEVYHKIVEYGKEEWLCAECKECGICRDIANEQSLLLCDMCDRGYHTFCLDPPLSRPPGGRWVCKDCVFCHSCGAKKPGREGTNSRWMREYTLCRACDKLIYEKKFCPVCKKAYRERDNVAMVCCDGCSQWVHATCDDIDEKKYKKLSKGSYYCPTCRQDKKVKKKKKKASSDEESDE